MVAELNTTKHLKESNSEAAIPAVDFGLQELRKSEMLSNEDTIGDKISREAQVMLGGAMLGLGQSTKDRLSNHLPATVLQTAAFGGFSYGMVRLASSTTPFRYALPVISAALSYSFIGNSLKEFPQQASILKNTWTDTWNSPANVRQNQQQIADTFGPFLFDTSLGIMAGLIGGKIAANQIENKTLLQSMKENHGRTIDESIFRVASEPNAKGLRNMGTSFAIEKDKIATAFHVVEKQPGEVWNFLNTIEQGKAKIVAGFPQRDLAILQSTEGSSSFKPIPIARTLAQGDAGVVVGIPGKRFRVEPAHFTEGFGVIKNYYHADLGPEAGGGYLRTIKGGKGQAGMSGGPAINQAGEVVGVLSSLNPVLNTVRIGVDSVPSANLRYFMNLLERSKQAGSTMSLAEAAVKFSLPAEKVVSQLHSGRLEGFVIPSKLNTSTWEWRILNPS